MFSFERYDATYLIPALSECVGKDNVKLVPVRLVSLCVHMYIYLESASITARSRISGGREKEHLRRHTPISVDPREEATPLVLYGAWMQRMRDRQSLR